MLFILCFNELPIENFFKHSQPLSLPGNHGKCHQASNHFFCIHTIFLAVRAVLLSRLQMGITIADIGLLFTQTTGKYFLSA